MIIDKQLIALQQSVTSYKDIITLLGERLYAAGYVTRQFTQQVLHREKCYPTGLKMKPYNIAMPHTDPDHVIQSSIAIASLTEPVTFYRMDHPSKPIEVTIVFVLAVKESQQQVKVIERLMNILRDQQFMKQLGQSNDENTIIEQLQYYLKRGT